METQIIKDLSHYRIKLEDILISKDGKTEFRFLSRRQKMPHLYLMEDDHNSGIVTVKDIVHNREYSARYELKDLHGRIVLDINFIDFSFQINGLSSFGVLSGQQGQLAGNFEDVMLQLADFPHFIEGSSTG